MRPLTSWREPTSYQRQTAATGVRWSSESTTRRPLARRCSVAVRPAGAGLGCGRVTHGHVRPFDRGSCREPLMSCRSCHCMQACGQLAKFPVGYARDASRVACRSARDRHGAWRPGRGRLSVGRSTMVRVRTRSCPGRDCEGAAAAMARRSTKTPPPDDFEEQHPRHRRRRRDAGLLPRVRVLGHLLPRPAGRPRRPQAGAPPDRLPDERDGPAPRPRLREVRPRRRRGHGQAAPARRRVDLRRPGAHGPALLHARCPWSTATATSARWATTTRRPPCGTPSAGWPTRRA